MDRKIFPRLCTNCLLKRSILGFFSHFFSWNIGFVKFKTFGSISLGYHFCLDVSFYNLSIRGRCLIGTRLGNWCAWTGLGYECGTREYDYG